MRAHTNNEDIENSKEDKSDSTSFITSALSYRKNRYVIQYDKKNGCAKWSSHPTIGIRGGNRYKLMKKLYSNNSLQLAKEHGVHFTGKVVLGSGQGGKVIFAQLKNKKESRFVVAKKIKRANLFESMCGFYSRLAAKKLSHVMLPIDIIKQKNKKGEFVIYQILPYANLGDGNNLIHYLRHLSREKSMIIIMHVATLLITAFKELHEAGIYHLDFNIFNLLINSKGEVFISDLDSAVINEEGEFFTGDGNLPFACQFASPESFHSSKEKEKSSHSQDTILAAHDTWQLGLALAMLASYANPTICNNICALNLNISRQKRLNQLRYDDINIYFTELEKLLNKLFEEISYFPDGFIQLIKGLLTISPSDRSTVTNAFDLITQSDFDKHSADVNDLFQCFLNQRNAVIKNVCPKVNPNKVEYHSYEFVERAIRLP